MRRPDGRAVFIRWELYLRVTLSKKIDVAAKFCNWRACRWLLDFSLLAKSAGLPCKSAWRVRHWDTRITWSLLEPCYCSAVLQAEQTVELQALITDQSLTVTASRSEGRYIVRAVVDNKLTAGGMRLFADWGGGGRERAWRRGKWWRGRLIWNRMGCWVTH